MIQQNTATGQTPGWQSQLSDLIREPEVLAELLGLSDPQGICEASQDFPLRVPRALLDRIKPGDLQDPVLLQCLPQLQERVIVAGFTPDPLNEAAQNPVRGVLRKFENRALITLTQSCAIHCRYCFRRNFNYADNLPGKKQAQAVLDYLAQDPHLEEVILSGGDPLTVSDDYLRWFIEQLSDIQHIQTLRIHTRLPILIPERITAGLLQLLSETRFNVVVVTHCNHAQEINGAVKAACLSLKAAGITLLNQAVLLKGINDTATVQIQLAKTLFDCGILPYYLHLLDPVQGAAHFHVDDSIGIDIITAMEKALQGYLVPRLVRETPGAASKIRLA